MSFGPGQPTHHRTDRHAHLLCNVLIAELLEIEQDERCPELFFQFVQNRLQLLLIEFGVNRALLARLRRMTRYSAS